VKFKLDPVFDELVRFNLLSVDKQGWKMVDVWGAIRIAVSGRSKVQKDHYTKMGLLKREANG